MSTVALQADNEGEFAGCSDCSANNGVILGSGCSGDCGHKESGNECFVLHLEDSAVLGSEGSECLKRISEWMALLES